MGVHNDCDGSRRQLLLHAARISAGIALTGCLPPAEAAAPASTIGKTIEGRRKAQIFTLDAVQLGPGPFHDAMERNRAYLLSLDPDRFLHYFRTTAGLPARADAHGG